MKFSKIILVPVFLILTVAAACSETAPDEKTSGDPFIEYIRTSTKELEISHQSFIESPSIYEPMYLLSMEDADYIISSDDSDKSILSMQKETLQ